MSLYTAIARPLLFTLQAENAHEMGRRVLSWEWPWRQMGKGLAVRDPRLAVDCGPMKLSNPVGLAPGLDKDGDVVDSLGHLGFGYLTIGSILPRPNQGNPKPRIRRLVDEEAISNALGLPSRGVDYTVARLKRRKNHSVPVIGNMLAYTMEDWVSTFTELQPHVDAIEIAPYCPNSSHFTDFTEPPQFDRLLRTLAPLQQKPIFVKLHPYDTESQRDKCFELVELAIKYGLTGVTLSGSFGRPDPRIKVGRGTVSGRPAFPRAIGYVRDLYNLTRGRMVIKALGGISTGQQAFEAIAAGADTVELLTAFVYKGWGVAHEIQTDLLKRIRAAGIKDIRELRGSACTPSEMEALK